MGACSVGLLSLAQRSETVTYARQCSHLHILNRVMTVLSLLMRYISLMVVANDLNKINLLVRHLPLSFRSPLGVLS